MENISLWKAISKAPQHYPTLTKEIEVDVAIIGGGITGITAAFHLVNAGKKVAVIEANSVGGVTTGYSSGNLYVAVQPYYQTIVSKFNLETATAIAKSRMAAIDFIENMCKEKNINCNFSRRPWFIYTDEENKISFLEKEVETFKKMGVDIEYVSQLPLPFKFKKAAVIQNQARFNCLQYVMDLANDLSKRGCQIYEKSPVTHMDENDSCQLVTKNGKVKCSKVLIATHTPIGINHLQLFTAPYRSYAVVAKLKDQKIPEGHFWDLSDPHHATCTHSTKGEKPDVVLVAGSHHKVGQEPNAVSHYQQLENFLRAYFPVESIEYKWSAQHYHAADGIPYIGLASASSKNTFLATGYFADGLVYGTIAGAIVSDLILAKHNADANIYQSQRHTLKASAPDLIKENSNVFLQYLKDFPIFHKPKLDEMKKGEAKIVTMGLEKWAAYKDEHDKLHVVSAICTHMKGVVTWNNAESTWDCPCHGSRFTPDGKVIEGPAMTNLKKKES